MSLLLPLPKSPWGHDGPIHAANVRLLAEAIEEGDWFPRWLPELNGGLGGPNFRYYASFAYYPSALLLIAGVPALEALRAACRAFFFLGFLGSGFLAWRLFGMGSALLVPLLFSLSPYPLALFQARLALPEFAALNLAPWAFSALHSRARRGRPCGGFLLSLLVALLLCVHTLAAIVWLPFLFLGAIFWGRGLRGAASTAGGVLGGVLLGAFRCAPSALELGWIDASRKLADTERFSAWAQPLSALLSNRPEEGFSARLVPGPLIIAVLALSCLLFLAQRLRGISPTGQDRKGHLFLLLALLALALSSQAGALVGRVVRPLSYIQFPWRFLGPLSFFAALLGGALVVRLTIPLRIVVSVAVLVAGWGLLLPRYGAAVPAEFPDESADAIRQRVYSGDYENKYLPLGARLPGSAIEEPLILPAGTRCEWVLEERRGLLARVVAARPARIVVRRYWFPGQRVQVDGKAVDAERDPLNGEIAVAVPAGSHDLHVYLEVRALDRLYGLVSATALLACLWGLLRSRGRLVIWLPCMVAGVVACLVGLLSAEGFGPPAGIRAAMEADAVVSDRPRGGWAVVQYEVRSGTLDFGLERRGFAAQLNLAPGGAIRDGTAVWAAELDVPAEVEAALQYEGQVLLFVDGDPIAMQAEGTRRLDGLRLLPMGSKPLGREGGRRPRVVVVASEIEQGAFARLVVRGPGEPWHLIPSEWIRPAVNKGYRELFENLRGGVRE